MKLVRSVRWPLIAALVGVTFTADAFAADPAAPAQAKLWKEAPDQAKVLTATLIGGKGNEWLVGGGFAPDGTIVLAGNVAGPVLEFAVPVQAIGTDQPAPPQANPVPEMERTKTGERQKQDKDGKPVFERPSWRHAGVTGFILRCSSDLKQVVSASRLPWSSATITSVAVGNDGSIFIAGRAADTIQALGGQMEELKVAENAARKDGKCDHAFVARLSADASKVQWVRHARGLCDAPQVSLLKDDAIRFAAQEEYRLDAGGKLLKEIVIPGGVKKTTSVSPIDGSIIVAGEHHWPTGREPWRCPIVNVHHPDGSLKHQFYDWGGPYVGLDNLRQVSDSAIRFVTHDRDGNILLYAWSDGGNSVMTARPYDVRTGVGLRGLGLSTAGAGVLSAAYLIRLDRQDYHVSAWTLWLSFLSTGKPNSVWIDNLALSDDGTVCMAGRSAWGLWQTGNRLAPSAPPDGQYVAILRRDLSGVRFCSVVPGTGAAEVSHDRAGWGIATGKVDGKDRVLFVGSAATGEGDPPTQNALQSESGGGRCDGYVILLELGGEEAAASVTTAAVPARHTSASLEGAATGKGKKPAANPPEGTVYHFKPDVPKWVTVDAEFRDRAGTMWPSFLYGKPVEGIATIKGGVLEAKIVVACTAACQPKGDQSRRVLGELFQGEQPPQLKLTLESLGKVETAEFTAADAKGKPQTRTVDYCMGQGTLELAGRTIPVTPKVTLGFGRSQGIYRGPGKIDQPVESVKVNAYVTLKASELGLTTPGPASEVDIRIGMSGLGLKGKDAPEK